jgi:hypothetical protein
VAIRCYKKFWLSTHSGLLTQIAKRCGVTPTCVAYVFWNRPTRRRRLIPRRDSRTAEIEQALAEYALAAERSGHKIDDPVSRSIRRHKELWLRSHRGLLEEIAGRLGMTGTFVRDVFWGKKRSATIEHALAVLGIIVGPPVRRRNAKAA